MDLLDQLADKKKAAAETRKEKASEKLKEKAAEKSKKVQDAAKGAAGWDKNKSKRKAAAAGEFRGDSGTSDQRRAMLFTTAKEGSDGEDDKGSDASSEESTSKKQPVKDAGATRGTSVSQL